MKYRYSGPTSGVTLQQGEDIQEVMLHTGTEVELPEDHEYTQTLLALGHLVLVKQATTKTAARTSAGTDETAAKGA
ncbi:hypothetical protein HF909_10460 [Ralstonia pseudosolanacearum]|uniref:Uncharacterized protein n=1 Tax=Ralstonia solanacearum TaxID=305 RepID=A0AA92K241_RALSL|nr:hypothetical protein [Ralstonia pseudosolanacearum]QOK96813.1 hypothetical protein HF909_10460 [Ralstonia pseudosolanacearum]